MQYYLHPYSERFEQADSATKIIWHAILPPPYSERFEQAIPLGKYGMQYYLHPYSERFEQAEVYGMQQADDSATKIIWHAILPTTHTVIQCLNRLIPLRK